MENSIQLSAAEKFFRSIVQKYNHEKYWRYRSIVIDPDKGSKLGDLFRLYYIKRADAFHNASMGTHRNFGASFAEPPQLPHWLNGIIVSHNAVIGKGCILFHQVTIGAGCVVVQDVPDNATVVMGSNRILQNREGLSGGVYGDV